MDIMDERNEFKRKKNVQQQQQQKTRENQSRTSWLMI